MMTSNFNKEAMIEWQKILEAFIISKEMADPRKVMSFAVFTRWSNVPTSLLDNETLENIYDLWLTAEENKKEYKHYVQAAEA